jgi:hypothetical protein
LYLFELSGISEIELIKEEVHYWTNLADNKKKEELKKLNEKKKINKNVSNLKTR